MDPVTFNKRPHFAHAFTVVELLVVIVVMSILTTIAFVSYGSWRERVAETEVKSDLTNLLSGMEGIRNQLNSYPAFPIGTEFDGSNSSRKVFTQSKYVKITYHSGSDTSFCVDVQSRAVPAVRMFLDASGSNALPTKGTCDGGVGIAPPPSNQTVFVFDTAAPGCLGTVHLPVAQPITGGTINWGDGVVQPLSSSLQSHTYSTPGKYIVSYEGPISQAGYTMTNMYNKAAIAKCLVRVNQWASNVQPTQASFAHASNLVYVAEPPHSVTDMSYMFYTESPSAFNQPIGNWDTSNVTNMSALFFGASAFNQPINNWNTSNVTMMGLMFSGATSFNQPISNFNTSKVTNMLGMFHRASSFNQSVANFDTSKVTDMQTMFAQAPLFNQSVANFNTSEVLYMNGMFWGASAFNQPVANFNTSKVSRMSQMFQNATSFNQPINSWNTSQVTEMRSMFQGATAFNQPLSAWNTSKVGTMGSMFQDASSFNQNLTSWNLGYIVNAPMFNGKSNFHLNSPLTQANCPPSLWMVPPA